MCKGPRQEVTQFVEEAGKSQGGWKSLQNEEGETPYEDDFSFLKTENPLRVQSKRLT
jgi:hypothetical protein